MCDEWRVKKRIFLFFIFPYCPLIFTERDGICSGVFCGGGLLPFFLLFFVTVGE